MKNKFVYYVCFVTTGAEIHTERYTPTQGLPIPLLGSKMAAGIT
jgi:hypothetical protein